jgi:ABC-type antimicrobial peptide transport system permease subunit
VTAVWLFLRAEARRRWRAWLSLALIVGVFTGGVVTAAAGALRTDSAYARFLDWSRAPDALVAAQPYIPMFARLSPTAVMRVPQAENAAVIKIFFPERSIQFVTPASDAIPGQFWKRKILSGRLADPGRPNEVNVSFALAQRTHVRAGDRLPLVMDTVDDRHVPFVFHVVGIDAATSEFPPQPGNGTYTVWGTPAFYRQHRELDGFIQIALRFHHGSRDWPAARQELRRHTHGMPVQAMLFSSQFVNTQRSIRPQAVALWLLAALFGVIGLLIVGQLLARLTFLEATGYGTLRALGMSRGQLMTGCLGRAVAIGAAGGVIGAVLGVALSPLLPLGLARVAEPHPGADADVPVLAAGVAAAVLVTTCCAAWPGWRATAERPLSGLAGPGRDRRGVVSRLAATGPVPLAMGTRLALHRGAGRTAVPVRSAVASAAVGVAALSAAIVFAGSLSHLLATPVLYGVTWDAVVGNDADTDMRPVVAAVRHDRQVAAWTAGWAGLPLRAGRTEFDAIVLPVPGGASFVPPPVTGRLPRTSREIALGMRTLRELHARIGTTIQVSAPLFNIPVRPMTIVGTMVFPTMSDALDLGTGAALSPGGLQYLLPGKAPIPPPGTVFVRFRPGVEPQAGREDLATRLARAGSFSVNGPATPTDLLNFGQVQHLPQVLGIGLAAVALLTIAHLLMTSVRRRRRDFAILRALGFTSWQVRGTLCWQALTLAGIALVIGVPAGIACGRLCWQVFAHQLGITPVVAVPAAVLAVMAAGWLAAAVVIAALPGEAATRNRAARVLHSE